MLRLRSEARFAPLTAPLSMTVIPCSIPCHAERAGMVAALPAQSKHPYNRPRTPVARILTLHRLSILRRNKVRGGAA